jgi:hypothetical protein
MGQARFDTPSLFCHFFCLPRLPNANANARLPIPSQKPPRPELPTPRRFPARLPSHRFFGVPHWGTKPLATKVVATDHEADRPDPEDLSPTRAEIEVCLADAPQYEEISESLLSLGKNKACGWDDVSARILNVDAVKDTMVQIVQQIWAEESLPAQMVQGALVMLHKGGGKSKEDLARPL